MVFKSLFETFKYFILGKITDSGSLVQMDFKSQSLKSNSERTLVGKNTLGETFSNAFPAKFN